MNLKSRASVPNFQSDGLSITAAEAWFKVKVQLVESYLQAFIMNASQKADEIVLVDLSSGSGLYSIGHRKEVFAGSCLASLSLEPPFHKWIFCESDPEQAAALDRRVEKFYPEKDVVIINASQSELAEALRPIIPGSKAGHKVAVLCLIDSFSLDIPWNVMEKLAAQGCSFLIPFTFMLNSRMDCKQYCHEHPEILKKLVGDSNYERLKSLDSNLHFYRRLIRMYQNNMLVMGLNSALSSHKLESTLMDLPAYCVGFFSKQFSTQAIQHDVNVSEHLQFELF